MLWLDSICYPFYRACWKQTLIWPALWVLGGLLFAGTISGGFLYTVGFNPLSVSIALLPCILVAFALFCIGAGYFWELLQLAQVSSSRESQDLWTEWMRYLNEGFQLLLFYSIAGLALGSAAMMFDTISSLTVLFLVILFHPILALPVVFATRDKTFLGLMDACLDALAMIKSPHYGQLWQQSSMYLLFAGCILYPLLSTFLGLSIVGLLLLPCLLGTFVLGYGHLLTYLCPQSVQKTLMVNNPFASSHGDPVVQSLYVASYMAPDPVTNLEALYHRQTPWKQ